MKKVIILCIVTLYFVAITQAQCPTQIVDDNGNGMRYRLLLSSDQCANFPFPSGPITIQGVDYLVSNCSNDFSIFTLTVVFNNIAGSTPVVLATDAPVTVAGNIFSNCIYNSVGSPIALPIELISFDAQNTKGAKNYLTWRTASEKDNSHFDIERSTDGNTFHNIGQVKGNNKPSSYQFVDNQPYATSYYRLRQIDFDGTETLSKIVSAELKDKTKGLKVYPTLVSNGILSIDTEGGQLRDFSVTNLLGQQVLVGKTTTQIDVSSLSQGTYVLKVGTEVTKFVKQ